MLSLYSAFPLAGLLLLAILSSGSSPQQPPNAPPQPPQRKDFMKEGIVEHRPGSAIVTANSPRPLAQALAVLREEYGWLIDYEDPPYQSEPDLTEVINPQWQVSHPGAREARGIAGGRFQSEYTEGPDFSSLAAREATLRKIVSDYNHSNNPGKFNVRAEGDGRFAIIGSATRRKGGPDETVMPILDTPVSIVTQQRSAGATVTAILKALSDKTSTKVILGTVPTNLLFQAQVSVGGEDMSARKLLLQTLDATGRPLHWRLLFDPTNGSFVLNIAIASRTLQNTYGQKYSVPIDYSPAPRNR